MNFYNLEYFHQEAIDSIESLRVEISNCDDIGKIETAIYEMQRIKGELTDTDQVCGIEGLRGIRKNQSN
ncbi:hypothetical protein [Lapidilactobacillus bayanensis]|uniref:hypothetical protein n=1 Tax=Lapidilactobacillus bayanensis TaxID=2485998 RepID=UPI000F799294|nr:hypothetical protein [Lapidilactobacillus bayanensis]